MQHVPITGFHCCLCIQAGVGAAKTVMMTMIPVDYHTCFVAISQHAKILYANESMANLLGRKVTEISKKMSLPQLLTIPCQQLHQNFFKVCPQSCCFEMAEMA